MREQPMSYLAFLQYNLVNFMCETIEDFFILGDKYHEVYYIR